MLRHKDVPELIKKEWVQELVDLLSYLQDPQSFHIIVANPNVLDSMDLRKLKENTRGVNKFYPEYRKKKNR
jgi:hypothetical protein